jgi:preprotein translocase subunit SecF
MKQLTTVKKIICILMALIIISGIIVVAVKGFNVELKYRQHQKIELNIGEKVELSKIQKVANEVFGKNKAIVQIIEVYKDVVQISAVEISEEQKNSVVEKINSLYAQENEVLIKSEDVKIITNANIRLRDILKTYISPILIVTIAILVYFAIRYHKLGLIKSVVKPGVILILTQLILLSVLAIIRFPMGSLTTPLVLIIYVISLICISRKMEKND